MDDMLAIFLGLGDMEECPMMEDKPVATSAEDVLKQIKDLIVSYFGEEAEPKPEEDNYEL